MHRLSRFGRALLLVLMLPALLAPSSWAMRVCFCDAMAWGLGLSSDDCCRPSAPISCCELETNSDLADDHQCSECRTFEVGNSALQVTPTPSVPDVPLDVVVAWIVEPPRDVRTLCDAHCARGPAPPAITHILPLRI